MNNANGSVFKYPDNVDTDVIIPARHLNTQDARELASHCMEDIDKDFIHNVKDGDIMVGTEKGQFKDFGADMFRDLSEAKRADIIRDGKAMSVALPGDINLLGMQKSTPQFARPMIPALVDSIVAGSIAQKIGLQKGDRIIAVNGKTIDSYNEFTNEV